MRAAPLVAAALVVDGVLGVTPGFAMSRAHRVTATAPSARVSGGVPSTDLGRGGRSG